MNIKKYSNILVIEQGWLLQCDELMTGLTCLGIINDVFWMFSGKVSKIEKMYFYKTAYFEVNMIKMTNRCKVWIEYQLNFFKEVSIKIQISSLPVCFTLTVNYFADLILMKFNFLILNLKLQKWCGEYFPTRNQEEVLILIFFSRLQNWYSKRES